MTPSAYQQLAGRTECVQHRSLRRMTGPSCLIGDVPNDDPELIPIRVNHSIIGMAGEAGEMCSLLQRWIYYGKNEGGTPAETTAKMEEMKKQFILEMGDLLWYGAELCNALGLDMEEVMKANIEKLKVRYPDRYTDHHAAEENRDRVKEEAHVGVVQDGHGFGHKEGKVSKDWPKMNPREPKWADSKGVPERCDVPPLGWHCTRERGHPGPCAAVPTLTPEQAAKFLDVKEEVTPNTQEP